MVEIDLAVCCAVEQFTPDREQPRPEEISPVVSIRP
jgi:hypothetical protein